MADEEDYLDLVIAGELVVQWLEVIDTSMRMDRVREAVEKLKEAIRVCKGFVFKALEENALPLLKKFLARSDEEWKSCFGDVQNIVEILEDHQEKCGSILDLKYNDYKLRIRQGALLDGLGARLWNVAHSFNQYLSEHGALVENKQILEIGSGCGSTGILAALMCSSSTVYLTDCVPSVLENLRASCRLNIPKTDGHLELESVIEQMNDELFESTTNDGESLDGIEDLLSTEGSWDVSNMLVRHFDWTSDCPQISSPVGNSEDGGKTPLLETDEQFDVILGSEVLYEERHPLFVASVLSHRLRDDGHCLIAGAVRDQSIYDNFIKECEKRSLNVIVKPLTDNTNKEYEGGVVLLTINRN